MPTLRDFVRRLRPLAVPGAAAPAGVPIDRAAVLAQELAPVLEALAASGEEAQAIVRAAREEADRRRSTAGDTAERLLAEAREQAEAARAAAAAKTAELIAGERAALLERARADAATIERQASARIPDLVGQVVARVRATGTEPVGEHTRSREHAR